MKSQDNFHFIRFAFLGALLLFFSACSPRQKKANATPDKAPGFTIGQWKDFSGLDGCRWMLITETGKKYRVVQWPEGTAPRLSEGLQMRFTFQIDTDAMSICMAEDANIIILEYDILKPAKKTCENILDPFRVNWMEALIEEHNPYRITQYRYEDGWAYYLECGAKNLLYDCQGTYLCDVPGRMYNACAELIAGLDGRKVIWVRNEKE
jgi:hypothetical protein